MTNNYKPIMGGVPISIERLARGLESLGHEVTIFAPTYQEQREMEEGDSMEEANVFRYATCMKHFIGGPTTPDMNSTPAAIQRESVSWTESCPFTCTAS